MKIIETFGKTVEEAIEKALEELGAPEEDVEIQVLAEPTRKFLGILKGQDAHVKATLTPKRVDLAKEFVDGVLKYMDIPASYEAKIRDDVFYIDVFGEDLGLLIGRRGETLRALELLTNVASGKGIGDIRRVVVDVAGYRQRRETDLKDMAESAALRVERYGRKVIMGAMDARDRRIVHLALQEHPYVATYSEGEEPFRRVVVELKDTTIG